MYLLSLIPNINFLFSKIKDYLVSGEIMRTRHLFHKNVKQLQAWISNAEAILSTPVVCKPKDLENYTVKLKVFFYLYYEKFYFVND